MHGLGVPPVATLWTPRVGLTPAPGGVLAVVDRQACRRCARSQTEFLIGVDGSARRLATQPLAAGTVETAPVRDSTAIWVLTWPPTGPCTVRLVPEGRSAVRVPCGDLVGDSPAGVLLSTDHGETILDPLTGRIRYVAAPHVLIFPLNRDLALDVAFRHQDALTGGHYGKLTLVNLINGHQRRLAWPSYFGDVIRVVPEPAGPLVAVDFGSPAYPGPAQAEDIWMLDTTTGAFTHMPAYPANVDIKFSSVAWTGDDRLVIVAQGGGRTVVGLWRPGAGTLPLRTVPSRNSGYYLAVPLVG